MSKVKLDVLRPWISKKITDILHIEDDVVVEFVYNQLEEEKVTNFKLNKKKKMSLTYDKSFYFSIHVQKKCKLI